MRLSGGNLPFLFFTLEIGYYIAGSYPERGVLRWPAEKLHATTTGINERRVDGLNERVAEASLLVGATSVTEVQFNKESRARGS